MGRAGQIILHERLDVLHVRVIAPDELRARRIAERTGVSMDGALAQVQASDSNRRNYLRRFYRTRWDDPLNYHLTINTAVLDVRQATQLIVRAVAVM
jgi:cytidylate kinase